MEEVRIINDPDGRLADLLSGFKASKNAAFILLTASSKVSEYEGISAAGVNPQARRLTPALDAEALILGATVSAGHLPFSPRGIVSPVVVSRGCLNLLGLEKRVVDCGSFQSPICELLRLSERVAECPSSGRALPAELVLSLFQKGLEIGSSFADYNDYLVVAECVPGGTTTALGLLSALSYDVRGLLSSSLPECNHEQRWSIVEQGLKKTPYSREQMSKHALLAVASLGDPMQAVACGIAMSASRKIPVFLGGGSQMLAVLSLIKSMHEHGHQIARLANITVMSTTWVVDDSGAGVRRLAELTGASMLAAYPDFHGSRHAGLQAYEDGNVKEGAGAGAALCLSFLSGFSRAEVLSAVDASYDEFTVAPE